MRRSLGVIRDNAKYNKTIYVKAETKNKAKELLLKLHNAEYKWHSGDSLLEFDKWNEYKENTYYLIDSNSKSVCYGKSDSLYARFKKTLRCVGL